MTNSALAMCDVGAILRPESGRVAGTPDDSAAALRVVEPEKDPEPITLGALLREVLVELQAECPAPDLPYRSR